MRRFKVFYISQVDFNDQTFLAKFHYSFDKEVFFVEEIDFSSPAFEKRKDIDDEVIQNLLFHISISLWISYYKLFPTKKIVVEWWYLSKEDKAFWKKFYLKGLWEFLYNNNISPRGLFTFASTIKKPAKKADVDFTLDETYLLPIGWGKDSIVSTLILQSLKKSITPVIVGKIDPIKQDFLDISRYKALNIQRILSNNLFVLNAEGYYNGHVPITGMISFILTFSAYLYNFKYIVFSNEKSAEEPNTRYQGMDVNHQYSKSLEFENDIRSYIFRNISNTLQYFSLLRGLYEIEIAKIFSKKGKKYFEHFSSCNKNFQIFKSTKEKKRWCGECPKCLFVYMILRPNLTKKQVLQIFWSEFYANKDLLPLFLSLFGHTSNKPFECVGEKEESLLAIFEALKSWKGELPTLLKYFQANVLGKTKKLDIKGLQKKYFTQSKQTNIPKELQRQILKHYDA